MKRQQNKNEPSMTLSFDSSYILSSIFKSISEAASITGTVRQSLIKAAYGDIISVKNRYWRVVPADFQIEPDDIGKLTLFEFDEAVGEDRRIYATKKMLRTTSMLESDYIKMITVKQNNR